MKGSSYKPRDPRHYTRAVIALKDLRHIADYIKPSDYPGLARKIRSAIASAGGAVRNAERVPR